MWLYRSIRSGVVLLCAATHTLLLQQKYRSSPSLAAVRTQAVSLLSRVEAWWQSVGDRPVTELMVWVYFRGHSEAVHVDVCDEDEE